MKIDDHQMDDDDDDDDQSKKKKKKLFKFLYKMYNVCQRKKKKKIQNQIPEQQQKNFYKIKLKARYVFFCTAVVVVVIDVQNFLLSITVGIVGGT